MINQNTIVSPNIPSASAGEMKIKTTTHNELHITFLVEREDIVSIYTKEKYKFLVHYQLIFLLVNLKSHVEIPFCFCLVVD